VAGKSGEMMGEHCSPTISLSLTYQLGVFKLKARTIVILPTKSESASYITLFSAGRDRFQELLSRSEAGCPLRRDHVLR